MSDLCAGVAKSNNVQVDYKFMPGYAAVVNSEIAVQVENNNNNNNNNNETLSHTHISDQIAKSAASTLEGAKVVPPPVVLSGEDFSYYRYKQIVVY
jgi:metal-dependent amidase/aminoacylase/carboxypeptidase family protein